jgi:hypothetical protein
MPGTRRPSVQLSAIMLGRLQENVIPPFEPAFVFPVREEDLGKTSIDLTILNLFVDGQGKWKVGFTFAEIDGTPTKERIEREIDLPDALSRFILKIPTSLNVTRYGFNFVIIDIEGEVALRYPVEVIRPHS